MFAFANENFLDNTAFEVLDGLAAVLLGNKAWRRNRAVQFCEGRPASKHDEREDDDGISKGCRALPVTDDNSVAGGSRAAVSAAGCAGCRVPSVSGLATSVCLSLAPGFSMSSMREILI